MIDITLMRVWDDPKRKYDRWVVQVFDDGSCLVVTLYTENAITKEQAIEKIKCEETAIKYWKHCTPIRKELSAVVRSAEEIIGIPGIKKFSIYIDDYTYIYYHGYEGRRIGLKKSVHKENPKYNYCGVGCFWLKNWLKDFKEIER